jgi:hypothetical protein
MFMANWEDWDLAILIVKMQCTITTTSFIAKLGKRFLHQELMMLLGLCIHIISDTLNLSKILPNI